MRSAIGACAGSSTGSAGVVGRLLRKSSNSSSRYASPCFSASHGVASAAISCWAIFTSRSVTVRLESPNVTSPAFLTSSAK